MLIASDLCSICIIRGLTAKLFQRLNWKWTIYIHYICDIYNWLVALYRLYICTYVCVCYKSAARGVNHACYTGSTCSRGRGRWKQRYVGYFISINCDKWSLKSAHAAQTNWPTSRKSCRARSFALHQHEPTNPPLPPPAITYTISDRRYQIELVNLMALCLRVPRLLSN